MIRNALRIGYVGAALALAAAHMARRETAPDAAAEVAPDVDEPEGTEFGVILSRRDGTRYSAPGTTLEDATERADYMNDDGWDVRVSRDLVYEASDREMRRKLRAAWQVHDDAREAWYAMESKARVAYIESERAEYERTPRLALAA